VYVYLGDPALPLLFFGFLVTAGVQKAREEAAKKD